MKKVFSLILAFVLVIGVFSFSAEGVTYRDSFPNTHRNTGGNIADLIAVAKTQIGYTELSTSTGKPLSKGQDGGYTKYGAWFGAPTTAWCAFFVAWCANQADISTSVIPRIGNCASLVNWYSKRGRYFPKNGFTPKAGDLIFFNWSGGSTAKHIGIVTGVSGNNVYVVEGNTGSSQGYRAEAKTRKKNASYILGYARPAYNDGSTYIGSHSFAAYAASKYGWASAVSGNYGSGGTSQLAVITGTAENISAHSATLMGKISNSSSYGISSSGFYFGESEASLKKKKVNSYTSNKNVSLSLKVEDLTVDKTYYYCTYAVIKGKTYKGPVYSFTTVDDRPNQIVLSQDSLVLGIGETNEIFSAVLPLNASNEQTKWLTSNEMVAVPDNGIITGVGAGNCTITVKSDYGNVSADCNVTVTLSPVKKIYTENINKNSIRISWEDDNIHDIVGYAVYRSTSLDAVFTCIGKTTTKEFLDSSLEEGKTYYYQVQCLGVSEEFNSEMSKAAKETASLTAPVIESVRQNDLAVNIKWSKTDGADKYYIYRSEGNSNHFRLIGESKNASFTDNKTKNGEKYFYCVAAKNKVSQSKLSKEISITCKEIAPPKKDFITESLFNSTHKEKIIIPVFDSLFFVQS
ncbi:MAG: CHAP domain-containing protein [Clostridia bacterium]|nr:CHAP domain-containing protein [Clostridia bacterium]